jgi:hypothetical protein
MILQVFIIINKTKNTKSILFYLYNKKANLDYEGHSISHLTELKNGTKRLSE